MKKMRYSPTYLDLLDSLKKINAILSLNPSPKQDVIIDSLLRLSQILSINDDSRDFIYDYFCENNLFGMVANLVNSNNNNVKIQMLQTIIIIIKNQTSKTWLYYIFSNKGLGKIISEEHLYEDDDLVAWTSSLLKMLSFLLDETTIKFFISPIKNYSEFPLLTQTLKLIDHSDSMVRSHARVATLNILKINDPLIKSFISNNIQVFHVVPNYLFKCWQNINERIDIKSISNLSTIYALFGEADDYLLYLNDLFFIDFDQSTYLFKYLQNECVVKLIDAINTPISEVEDSNCINENRVLNKFKNIKLTLNNDTSDNVSEIDNSNLPNGIINNINDNNLQGELIKSVTPSSFSSNIPPSPGGDELIICDECTYRGLDTPEDVLAEEPISCVRKQFHPLIAAFIFIQIFKFYKDEMCTNLKSCFAEFYGIEFFNKIKPFLAQIFSCKFESIDTSFLILLELIYLKLEEIKGNEVEQVIVMLTNMWEILYNSMDWNSFTNINFRIITLRNLTSLTLKMNATARINDFIPRLQIEEPLIFEHLSIIWDEWLIFKSTCNRYCRIGFQSLFVPQLRNFGSILIQFGNRVEIGVDGVKANKFMPPYYLIPTSPVDLFRYRLQATLLFKMLKIVACKKIEFQQIIAYCPLVMHNWNLGFIFGGNLSVSPRDLPVSNLLRLGGRISLSNSILCKLDSNKNSLRHFIANDMLFILASSENNSSYLPAEGGNKLENCGEITCLHPLWNVTIRDTNNNSLTVRILSTPGIHSASIQKKQKHYDRERITGTHGSPSALAKFQLTLHFDELSFKEKLMQHVSKASDKLILNCQESFNLYMNI